MEDTWKIMEDTWKIMEDTWKIMEDLQQTRRYDKVYEKVKQLSR